MRKHKNATQVALIIEFMENHPDLAKGFTKKDKPLVECLWQELVVSLNAAGPPTKDLNGWKKVWTEWKSEVKKKLAHNKVEAQATGGGPFSKHNLTNADEAIVRICGIAQAVEGIRGISMGLNEDEPDETAEEMPSTTKKRCLIPHTSNTPKRLKQEPISQRLTKFLDDDNDSKNELNKKIDELITIQKENASSFRRIYRSIEKSSEFVGMAVTELKNEFQSMSARMLTAMQEKNQLKKQQLELELAKFDLGNQKK